MPQSEKDGTEMMYMQRIHYLLYSRHMTKKQLAKRAGMTECEFERLLGSEIPNISLEQAAAIAETLDVTMNYLIIGE